MDRKIVYSELFKLHARKQRDENLKEISGDMGDTIISNTLSEFQKKRIMKLEE